MSNLARKYQQQIQTKQEAEVQIKTTRRKSRITPGEKILGLLLIAFVVVMAVQIISTQSKIYVVNKDIQDVKIAIQEQEKVNGDLEIQVSEMSRYEEVWKKANELGLTLDENNVRVVEVK